MKYRSEIDGLRAVAVLSVIFFHAGFKGFRGGFVGVDIFFVISGYLITTIILSDMEMETFSLVRFYERRARRILPALFLVMLCCIPFAWFWLPPDHLEDFSQSLAAVSMFSSNFLFWKESGYFSTAAELKPLLHTWSLAVEEQYYLLFPLFIMLFWKLRKRWMFGTMLLVAAFSLLLAELGTHQNPSATFYLLPTRGWEIAIGALIACCLIYSKNHFESIHSNKLICEMLGSLGLVFIAFSVCAFDKSTPFPGMNALIPTIGTGLIILFTSPQTSVGRLLGTRAMVGIGLISYSTYLWHHPLFVFARHRSLKEPSVAMFLMLSAMSIVFGYLSWRYVERPFRSRGHLGAKGVLRFSAFGSLLFIMLGMSGHFYEGFAQRLSQARQSILSFKDYDFSKYYREGTCLLDPEQSFYDFASECGPAGNHGTTMIWGDSHAAALSYGIRTKLSNVAQYTASGCPPAKDASVVGSPNCKEINDYVLNEIETIQPDELILHANWSSYGSPNPSIGLGPMLNYISKTIEYVSKISPGTHVKIVGSVPQWQPSLPDIIVSNDDPIFDKHFLPLDNAKYKELSLFDKQIEVRAKMSDVEFVSPIELLCKGDRCPAVIESDNGFSLTSWDYGHLTAEGSLLLAEKILDNNEVPNGLVYSP